MQRNRRVYAGFYRKYDSSWIYVITVVKDVDTGAQHVIFHNGVDACECKAHSMTKESFCEMVEVDGEWVDKFTRQTTTRISDTHIENLNDSGFDGPVRVHRKDEEVDVYSHRSYRTAKNYIDYARDLLKNYKLDKKRYKLCMEQKRFIGVDGKTDFKMMEEDLAFLRDCLKTVLNQYVEFFKERYIQGKSIRKYAEEHEINRGSAEYLNNKLVRELAGLLKSRDISDGICRLKKN